MVLSAWFIELVSIAEDAKKENKLLMYIADFKRQLDYLYKLIKIINVQNLTQVGVYPSYPTSP